MQAGVLLICETGEAVSVVEGCRDVLFGFISRSRIPVWKEKKKDDMYGNQLVDLKWGGGGLRLNSQPPLVYTTLPLSVPGAWKALRSQFGTTEQDNCFVF